MTVGDALKKLSALDPRYRWIESDGVIVVRPIAAWSDPKNVLNYQTESFVLKDATLGDALNASSRRSPALAVNIRFQRVLSRAPPIQRVDPRDRRARRLTRLCARTAPPIG